MNLKKLLSSLVLFIALPVSVYFLLFVSTSWLTRANSSSLVREAELAALSGGVTTSSDAGASGGQYIQLSPDAPVSTTNITYISSTTARSAKGITTVSVPVPTGLQNGDVLIAMLQADYANIGGPPAGWELITERPDGTDLSIHAFYKRVNGAEPAQYTWNVIRYATPPDPNLAIAGGTMLAFRGVHTSSPIFSSITNTNTANTARIDCLSTSAPAGGMLVCGYAHDDPQGNISPPSSMTRVSNFTIPTTGNQDDGHATAYERIAVAGQTGVRSATVDPNIGGGRNDLSLALVLNPLSSGPLPTATATPVPTASATPTPTPAPTTTPVPTTPPGGTPPPVPAGRITRSGSRLMQNGSPFKFAGTNISWLAMRTDGNYPTNAEIDDVLETAAEIGITVVRSHTLGVSVGCSKCLFPSEASIINNQPNAQALERIQYALNKGKSLGIHFIIPLSDEAGGGGYYSGGNRNFESWGGGGMYSSTSTKELFKKYITNVITALNAQNPNILAWETGNEMRTAAIQWTLDITAHIKATDSTHLVLDGNDFFKDGQYASSTTYLDNPNVDIFQTHHYPISSSIGSIVAEHSGTASRHNKAFIEGEHGMIDGSSYAALETLYREVENNPNVSGALAWQLFGHADHHGYLSGNSQFSVHYPGETTDTKNKTGLWRAHAFRLRGLSNTPASSVPRAPTLHSISGGSLTWRGAVGANSYVVERSTDQSTWTQVGTVAHDNLLPWSDSSGQAGTRYYYRVKAVNRDGVQGAASNVQSYTR